MLIDRQCETLKENLHQKDTEILELKDIIRLKNQEYELLKQKYKDVEIDLLSAEDGKSENKYRAGSNYANSDNGSPSQHRSYSARRSSDQPIQPYGEHRKDLAELQTMIKELQEENDHLRSMISQNDDTQQRKSHNDNIEHRNDNDGTVVIGGISNMNLNTTDENNASVKNCRIEMSPIEIKDRDASAVDDALLGVFDRSASNPRNRASKRRLDFDDNENIENQNIHASAPELDNIQSNKDTIYQVKQVSELKQEISKKNKLIDELTGRLEYYTKNSKNDYSSPRFMEPEYLRHERTRNQRLTAENVFHEIVKVFENTETLYDSYIEKYDNFIDKAEKNR